MTNPTPIEMLLMKLEEARAKAKLSLVSEILYLAIHGDENQALIEAFREVLGALNTIRDGGVPHGVLANVQERMLAMTTKATEALARANEIASQALGETKS